MNKKLMVQREPFEYEGKQYFGYFIAGVVRGREVRMILLYTIMSMTMLNRLTNTH